MKIVTTSTVKAKLDGVGNTGVSVSYSPENLQLGKAIDTFIHPRLPMIGADDVETFERLREIYAPFREDWEFVGKDSVLLLETNKSGRSEINITNKETEMP